MSLERFHFTSHPEIEAPSLIVGWMRNTGGVGVAVADYLAKASGSQGLCRIAPTEFFAVGGVEVVDDVARLPQARFFYDERDNAIVMRSDEPQSHRYEFLSAVLDLAEHYRAERLVTVNGIASMIPHTGPRHVYGVFNDPRLQRELHGQVPADLTWQGTPHTSTYLLWLAGRRPLPGVGLWVEVPFYLANYEDAQAVRTVIELFGGIFERRYDLSEFDARISEQDEALAEMRQEEPEIDARISAVERGETLSKDEQLELIEAVEGALQGHSG